MSRSASKSDVEQVRRGSKDGGAVRLGSKERRGSKGVVRLVLNEKIPIALAANLDVWEQGKGLAEEFVHEAQIDRDLDALDPDSTLQLPISRLKGLTERVLQLSLSASDFEAIQARLPIKPGATEVSFEVFFKCLNTSRPKAFEGDDKAGFDHDMIKDYQDVFEKHCKANEDELRTNQMFEVWRELGMDLSTTEKQQEMIQVIKDFDADNNGLTSFGEFLQIMRDLQSKREVAQNEADWAKIRRSKFPPQQVDQFMEIFNLLKEQDVQTNLPVPVAEAFTLTSLRNLYEQSVGRKLSADEVKVLRDKINSTCGEEYARCQFIGFPAYVEVMAVLYDEEFCGMKREDPGKVAGPPMGIEVQKNRVLMEFLSG